MLYLTTMLVAPWLLRQGQHIRVDIVLTALPPRLAWSLEWVGDMHRPGLLPVHGLVRQPRHAGQLARPARSASRRWSRPSGGRSRRCRSTFLLLSIEMLFRMKRLHAGERGPRQRRGERRMSRGRP